jgi:hypothetical protein
MSTCRSCGADITWAVTTRGRRIPLDTAIKNVAIPATDPALDGPVTVTFVSGHETHFATCPNADEHRR